MRRVLLNPSKRRLPAPKLYDGLQYMGLMVDLSVIYFSDETKTLPSLRSEKKWQLLAAGAG
jgi:hypothetical protein